MEKKKVLIHSNHSRLLTGFGKNSKNILKYLSDTGKYEVIELANGISHSHSELKTMPWRTLGGLPNTQAELDSASKDPALKRSAGYGGLVIDKVIEEVKPDVYIGVEDIWAFSGYYEKPWWNKINCMVWTTLDSLPILPEALRVASEIKNYYVWASFAQKALAEKGCGHVKKLHGSTDPSNFYRLEDEKRSSLRQANGIDLDDFVIGFVFRNQLRKSVPYLLDGFSIFKKRNPKSKAKLLLHTNWTEGWDIPRLIEEKSIDKEDVLATYFCSKCNSYEVKPFTSNENDCRFCGSKGSQSTVSVSAGVDELQLNEVYNLMDVYCHPFTSGGQELPIQEAKLTELITLVTDYACGTDSSSSDSAGFPLKWSEYREPGTQFIKASTDKNSIAKYLEKILKMPQAKRKALGKKARKYILENYSIQAVGKELEGIIDSMPAVDWDFNFSAPKGNPNYNPPEITSDIEWVTDLYKNILLRKVGPDDEGVKHWIARLESDLDRGEVLNYFKKIASQNESSKQIEFDEFLDDTGNKRALLVFGGSASDLILCTTIFKSFTESHPNYDLYVSCKNDYHHLISGHPSVHKLLPFRESIRKESLMLGFGSKDPYFDYFCDVTDVFDRDSSCYGTINNQFSIL